MKGACGALIVLGAILVAACTEDLNVGTVTGDGGLSSGSSSSGSNSTSSGSSSGGLSSGGSSGSSGAAGSSSGSPDVGCNVSFTQAGDFVPIQYVQAGPPQYTGGTLVPGTYVLTGYHVYGAGPQGTGNVRETIVLTGSPTVGAIATLSEIEETTGDFTAHGPLGQHATYMGNTGSPALFLDQDCPSSDNPTIEFTASSTTLLWFDDISFTEHAYQKQP